MNTETTHFHSIRHDLIASKSINWIASAETKATAGLTLEAVLIGFVMMGGKHDPAHQTLTFVFWLFLVFATVGAGCCLFVLWPRTHRVRLLGIKGACPPSPSFFKDVTALSFESFKAMEISESELEQDAIEQAYILAKIAKIKMWWVKVSFLFLGVSVLLLALMALANFHSW